MASEDLLQYLKLEAEVFDSYTVHTLYKRNRAVGAIEKVETKWVRTKTPLGKGAFGKVWLEQSDSPGKPQNFRAVKVVKKEKMRRLQIDYKKELLALATFSKEEYRHAEVLVSFLNWFETDKSIFLAMEYFQHGDLAMHINSISSEDEVRQITIDLLQGLKIMHSECFTHRDLNPKNIFVVEKPPHSARWWVKIGDFGISKRVKNGDTALRTETGTPCFQAPEIHGFLINHQQTSEYDNSVDVWSLGCVVYNISAQQVPFAGGPDLSSFCQKRSQLRKGLLSRVLGEAGIEFVQRSLVPEPAQRMTIEQGLQDPWTLNASPPSSIQPKHVQYTYTEHPVTESNETRFATKSRHNADSQESHPVTDQTSENRPDWTRQTSSPLASVTNRTLTPETPAKSTQRAVPITDWSAEIVSVHRNDTTGDIYAPAIIPESLTSQYRQRAFARRSSNSSDVSDGSMDLEWHPVVVSSKLAVRATIDQNGVFELLGHTHHVNSVAFSPDGKMLASGSDDKTIRLWSTATGQVHRQLLGHTNRILSVAFSPDGTLLASGSADITIRIWNIATGKVHREFFGQPGWVQSVAFSPDGTLLASGAMLGTIRLWNIATGQIQRELSPKSGIINSVAFSPHGTLLASGSDDDRIRLWNIATGQIQRRLSARSGLINSVAFSPDGILLTAGSTHGMIRLWNIATTQIQRELPVQSGLINSVAFSPDGSWLASGSNQNVHLWPLSSGKVHRELSGHTEIVNTVAFSPDGTLVASGSADTTIRLWSVTAAPASITQISKTPSTLTKFSKMLFG